MNPHQLLRLFPHASNAVLQVNSVDYGAGAPPLVERGHQDALALPPQANRSDTARFLVRVQSVRKKLLDEDRISECAIVDCVRYAGIIPDDRPAITRIETTQRKVAKGEEEHTKVEVYEVSWASAALTAPCDLHSLSLPADVSRYSVTPPVTL